MTDGASEAAALDVDDDHYNVARIDGEDCCMACYIQSGEGIGFRALNVDGAADVVEALKLAGVLCPACFRGRILEDDDPFIEQWRRIRAEGRSS